MPSKDRSWSGSCPSAVPGWDGDGDGDPGLTVFPSLSGRHWIAEAQRLL